MTAPELDLDSLRLLVELQDHGSIGAAARQLGVTQPAASKRLRQLEARWRLPLVTRSTRGAQLTVDGEAVAAWSRRLLHEADLMRSALEALTTERRSGLAVAASLTVAEFMLPRWMAELRVRMPQVRPQLRVVNSRQVVDLVRHGQVDLGFIETADVPDDLELVPLGRDRLAVVCAPDHPWAGRRRRVSRTELRAAEYVLREEGSGTRTTFEVALGRSPVTAFEAGSTATLVAAALAGMGPAVVSARAVTAYLETGRLVEVRHDLDLWRPVSAVRPRRQRFAPQVDELVRLAHLPATDPA